MIALILGEYKIRPYRMNSKQKAVQIIRGFYPIVDVSYTPDYPAYKLAGEILSSGVGLLQLRQKNIEPEQFLKIAREISYLKVHNPFYLIINHFVGVARQVGATGVHLGATSVSIAEARKIMGADAIIGVSVHSIEEGIQKEREGADYLTFGAIYPTTTKGPDHPVQGIEKLKELVSKASIPIVAIGGITRQRVEEIKKTSAAAFSVITAVSRSENPAKAAADFSCIPFTKAVVTDRPT